MVFAGLMFLVLLTIGASTLSLGHFLAAIIAVAIASTKAALIIIYFMHVGHSKYVIWAFASVGFFGVVILFLLFFGDYAARGGVLPEAFL
jgi:cytochrome c oxidase subunit 4